MTFTALDMIVLLAIGAAAVLGLVRGFVTEVLALLAWVLIVVALKFFHSPLAQLLAKPVGTAQGAAVLSFAIIAGVTYFGGRLIANSMGARTRDSLPRPARSRAWSRVRGAQGPDPGEPRLPAAGAGDRYRPRRAAPAARSG